MKKTILKALPAYAIIVLGSALYSVATALFIFPLKLLLGGTTGVSVILTHLLPFDPGVILQIINYSLLIVAFLVLGKKMGVRTLVGTVLTTSGIFLAEKLFAAQIDSPVIRNPYFSAVIGALIIAAASGMMFYVDASSGGTDILALIIRKYSGIHVGKALLATDLLIVAAGGVLEGKTLALASLIGLLLKTLGIDLVISLICRFKKTE